VEGGERGYLTLLAERKWEVYFVCFLFCCY
jgi:hypothetical protein